MPHFSFVSKHLRLPRTHGSGEYLRRVLKTFLSFLVSNRVCFFFQILKQTRPFTEVHYEIDICPIISPLCYFHFCTAKDKEQKHVLPRIRYARFIYTGCKTILLQFLRRLRTFYRFCTGNDIRFSRFDSDRMMPYLLL